MSFDQKMKDGGWRGGIQKTDDEPVERRDTYGQIQSRRLLGNQSVSDKAFDNLYRTDSDFSAFSSQTLDNSVN